MDILCLLKIWKKNQILGESDKKKENHLVKKSRGIFEVLSRFH